MVVILHDTVEKKSPEDIYGSGQDNCKGKKKKLKVLRFSSIVKEDDLQKIISPFILQIMYLLKLKVFLAPELSQPFHAFGTASLQFAFITTLKCISFFLRLFLIAFTMA